MNIIIIQYRENQRLKAVLLQVSDINVIMILLSIIDKLQNDQCTGIHNDDMVLI